MRDLSYSGPCQLRVYFSLNRMRVYSISKSNCQSDPSVASCRSLSSSYFSSSFSVANQFTSSHASSVAGSSKGKSEWTSQSTFSLSLFRSHSLITSVSSYKGKDRTSTRFHSRANRLSASFRSFFFSGHERRPFYLGT